MKAVIRHIELSPQSSCDMLLSRYGTAPVQVWIKRMTTIRGEQQMVITRGLHSGDGWLVLADSARSPITYQCNRHYSEKVPGHFSTRTIGHRGFLTLAVRQLKLPGIWRQDYPIRQKTLRQIGTGAIFQSQAIHWNNSAMRITFAEWSWKSAVQAKLAAATNQPFCPPHTPMVSPALL